MANLRVRKACSRRRRRRRSSSAIKVLPKELLMEVLARVASGSVSDLYKAKVCCREFLHASDNDYVYEHVSLEKFPLIPWFVTDKEFSFLKRCKESGNSESLYRDGMVEYFSSLNLNSGLESLRMASQKGHKDANYVYGMILICSDDEGERKQGLQLLRFLKMSKCIKRSRKRVKSFIWSMWVRNRLVRIPRPLCQFHTFQNVSRGWPSLNEEEDDGIDVSCEYCIGDYELSLFCGLLRV
ncbi:hypothetical protein QN277_006326 [Acacia crassicarpa]|uniref:At2g35280-like TPR domain-containing protein n=1 Tax=Acacia crassicarpa TaxID=499986 RepID=A0AAE1ITB6_9FABA|nr:hypothetical protein QN277_006326 [Acacia crassicarpa]